MRSHITRVLAISCCLAACATGVARAATVPAAALELRPSDLPGFTVSKQSTGVGSAASFGGSPAATAMLKHDGFRKGVSEILETTDDGGAISSAAVFSRPRGARALFKLEHAKTRAGGHDQRAFTVRGIPGASGAVEGPSASSGPQALIIAGVLLTSGRCYVAVLFDALPGKANGTTRKVEADASAGARAIYRRVRRRCA